MLESTPDIINFIVIRIILVSLIVVLLVWSSPLISEFMFYKSKDWDFEQDSGSKVFLAKELSKHYTYLKIGHCKIIMLANFAATLLILLLASFRVI